MQWFRFRARIVAAVTLVSLTALGGLSSAAHGGDCHDDDCFVALIAHAPASHGIGTTTADAGHPLHCILCHWTRTLRPSTEAVDQIPQPFTSDVRPQTDISAALSPVRAAQPPLRSPPLQALAV